MEVGCGGRNGSKSVVVVVVVVVVIVVVVVVVDDTCCCCVGVDCGELSEPRVMKVVCEVKVAEWS